MEWNSSKFEIMEKCKFFFNVIVFEEMPSLMSRRGLSALLENGQSFSTFFWSPLPSNEETSF